MNFTQKITLSAIALLLTCSQVSFSKHYVSGFVAKLDNMSLVAKERLQAKLNREYDVLAEKQRDILDKLTAIENSIGVPSESLSYGKHSVQTKRHRKDQAELNASYDQLEK